MVKKVKLKFHSFPLKTLIEFWKSLTFKAAVTGALWVCSIVPSGLRCHAQTDSLRVISSEQSDTATVKRLDPRKALFYSAVLPGLGQIYNRKYWKLPLVYGAFAGMMYGVTYYQKFYGKYKNELFIVLSGGKAPSGKSEKDIRYIIDKARRQRDKQLIYTGFVYLLQIVDAHVDAHLQEFKINKEMKISWEPALNQNMMIGKTAGFQLTLKF